MKLNAVHHVAILVKDYQKSRHFYVDLLGFTVIREHYRPEKNDYKLDLAAGDIELELFSAPNAPARVTGP
ncbi:MAG: VOC family protein, partial [Angelakisella sp.]